MSYDLTRRSAKPQVQRSMLPFLQSMLLVVAGATAADLLKGSQSAGIQWQASAMFPIGRRPIDPSEIAPPHAGTCDTEVDSVT
jgi:hypothetical protein